MGLHELIRDVKRRAASDDPLDRLAAAAERQRELVDQLDELLDHFVREARGAGRSWTEIGDVLGVSKQAAQQRHRPGRRPAGGRGRGRGRFGRFTPAARATVIAAQGEARALGHRAIGTEHVLLGLLDEPGTPVAELLARWDVDRESVEAAIVGRDGSSPADPPPDDPASGASASTAGDDPLAALAGGRGGDPGRGRGRGRGHHGGWGHIPFTRTSKKVLELALREARALEHRDIGDEHVLLGLLRAEEGTAAQILAGRGVSYGVVRDAVAEA